VEQPLPAERQRRIREVLRARGSIRVVTLAELLGVSEVTVRRDLEELEGRGLLERTHGGAIEAQRLRVEAPYRSAIELRPSEKQRIGEAAASLLRGPETVFMNGGTTTLQVFRRIGDPAVTVVTNHVGMALESDGHPCEVHLVGGAYRANSNSCVGPFATEAIRRVFASRSVIGAEGVSIRSGLTTPAAAEAEVARVMIEQTQGPVVVVADHTKIGTVADFGIAEIERVHVLVTDEGIDAAYREELEGRGIEVVVAGAPVGVGSGAGHG
jgi:DeoR family fructose operon transcriptional repressor